MARQSGFYVYLPSNNITDSARNTLTRYWTNLQRSIELEGEWEVALTEISYTMSWYNVQETTVSVCTFGSLGHKPVPPSKDPGEEDKHDHSVVKELDLDDDDRATESSRIDQVDHSSKHLYDFKVNPGLFTVQEMVACVNAMVVSQGQDDAHKAPCLVLSSDHRVYSITGKRSIEGLEVDTFLLINDPLASLLGCQWEEKTVFNPIETNDGMRYKYMYARFPDSRQGRYALFVYTDIIKTVHVGDRQANLLRIVHIPDKGSFGQQMHATFHKPEYRPLATSEISTVEIYIKDENGDDIPFEFGRTIVTLHFRRAKTHYD